MNFAPADPQAKTTVKYTSGEVVEYPNLHAAMMGIWDKGIDSAMLVTTPEGDMSINEVFKRQ